MQAIDGAPDRIRTRDPLITNQVLYQLSYKGSGDADSISTASVKQNPRDCGSQFDSVPKLGTEIAAQPAIQAASELFQAAPSLFKNCCAA